MRCRAGSRDPRPLAALLAHIQTWIQRDRLDKAIADGASLQGNLALRARQLTRRSSTRALAAELEATLAAALYGSPAYNPGDLDLSCDAIASAKPILEALLRHLRASSPLDARGIALARQMLRDENSPLYGPARSEDLNAAALAALEALGVASPPRQRPPLPPSDHVVAPWTWPAAPAD